MFYICFGAGEKERNDTVKGSLPHVNFPYLLKKVRLEPSDFTKAAELGRRTAMVKGTRSVKAPGWRACAVHPKPHSHVQVSSIQKAKSKAFRGTDLAFHATNRR